MALTDHPRRAADSPGVRRTLILAGGDALAFLLFAMIGIASHRGAASAFDLPVIAGTAAPFAAGWFAAAPFTGAYRPEQTATPGAMLRRTALAWLLGCPIGLALRGLANSEVPPPTFAVITFVTTLIILGGWRAAFAWLSARGGVGARA